MSFPTLQEGDRLFSTDPAHPLIQLHDLIEDVAAVAAFPRGYDRQPRPQPGDVVQGFFFWSRLLQRRVDELVENFIPIPDVPLSQNGQLAIGNTSWDKQDNTYTAEQARVEAGLPGGQYRRSVAEYGEFEALGGEVERGDILGPWLYEDMFKVLSLCRYKKVELASNASYLGTIGRAQPTVPSGVTDPCEWAYGYADAGVGDEPWDFFSYDISFDNIDLARHFSVIIYRTGNRDPSRGRVVFNISATSSAAKISPYYYVFGRPVLGYRTGLPESVSALATVYGWGLERDDRSGLYPVYDVVPSGYPSYADETWVEWTSSSDLYREDGTGFEFPISKYIPATKVFSLNYAGRPCPDVAADYHVGSRPIPDSRDFIPPFAILDAQYTPPPEPDAYTYDLDIQQIDPEEPILA